MVKAVIFPKDLLGFQTAKINFKWNIKDIIDNNLPAHPYTIYPNYCKYLLRKSQFNKNHIF